jgi:propanediol dehydratase small subunit
VISAQYLLLALIAVVAVIFTAWQLRGGKAALQAYWHRSTGDQAWKDAFPSVGSDETQRFLFLFVDAFAFSRTRASKFLPSDRVYAIYRALYPSKESPDALEVETFARVLKEHYGVAIGEMWSDSLTLGQIFSSCRVPAA